MSSKKIILATSDCPKHCRNGRPHFAPSQMAEAALAFREAGLSFMPISSDGTKMPAFAMLPRISNQQTGDEHPSWSVFQRRQPKKKEIRTWFDNGTIRMPGIAIIAGEISGNLEIIDFDNAEVFAAWESKMRRVAKELLDSIVWVRSPRPGFHAYYRCESVRGNAKLAERPYTDEQNKQKRKTLIEIKGNGGYCLAPPSPADCHPSKRRYRFLTDRDFTMLSTIPPAEREVLLACARELNEIPDRKQSSRKARPLLKRSYGQRPGDVLNATATWAEILEPHGWELVSGDGDGVCHWRRPGKDRGGSATTNFCGNDLLHVFSSNADPFDPDSTYDKFAAFALLNHGGNFHRAAAALTARSTTSPTMALLRKSLLPGNKYSPCKE